MKRTVCEVDHLTRYAYGAPAAESVMLLCLEPGDDRGQQLCSFSLETRPRASLVPDIDCFGNRRHILCLHERHDALDIRARSVVVPAPDPALPRELPGDAWERLFSGADPFDDWDFLKPSALTMPSGRLDEFARSLGIGRSPDPLRSVLELSQTLYRVLDYLPGSTSAESTIDRVLATGSGVCQDYAHLMIAIARAWGIPSRYVSGFLCPGGESAERASQSTTHAWVECRFPDLGWVGFDPTNDCLAGSAHIRIATGRDFRDVSPTRGVLKGGGETTLTVDVTIRSETA